MYIENYLELIANTNPDFKFEVDKKDVKMLTSFSSQVKKNIGLTDRQYNLAKEKILEYKQQFLKYNFTNLEDDILNLKIPIRQIDRSKTVKIVEKEYVDLFGIEKKLMIAVRFPYSSKMIKYIELIHSLQGRREYNKETKTHFLELKENIVKELISKLKEANFEIDKELFKFYQDINKMVANPENYVPGIYNYELQHVHANCKKYAINLLGMPCKENLALFYDRRDQFGLGYFDKDELEKSFEPLDNLSLQIAKTQNKKIFLSKDKFTHKEICNAIASLKRFPLLIVLEKHREHDGLIKIYENIKTLIDLKNISVLFRLDNSLENDILFNKAVQDLKLNNPITKTTQVIFLNNEKIPKPLITSKWYAETTLLLESFRNSRNITAYHHKSDLVIHYDTIPTSYGSKNLTHL